MLHLEEPNPILENPRYQKLHTLGKGSFGSVLLARDGKTSEVAAVKSIRRTEVNKYVEGEIMNHSLLRHPHVIQFKEVFLTRDYVCIAMEYATGGSLFHYVQRHGRLKEPVARWFFQQLVLGVDYCHKKVRRLRGVDDGLGDPSLPGCRAGDLARRSAPCRAAGSRQATAPTARAPRTPPQGVANRDIKLENTLLQEVSTLPLPLVKICDFGYSKADFRSAAKSKVRASAQGERMDRRLLGPLGAA
jgi:serine/threonine-protein kinase SRK2